MNNWRTYVRTKAGALAKTARRHPVETVIAVVMSVVCAIMPYMIDEPRLVEVVTKYSVIVGPVALLLNKVGERYRKVRVVYGAMLAIYVALVVLWMTVMRQSEIEVAAWMPTVVVESIVALLLVPMPKDDRQLTERMITMAYKVSTSFFAALCATAVIAALIATTNYIFGTNVEYYICLLPLLALAPMLVMEGDEGREGEEGREEITFVDETVAVRGRGFDGVMNFVVSVGIVLYILILYVYGARILVGMELPKGGVAVRVFWFVVVAVAARNMYYFVRERVFEKVYRGLHILSLPVVVLLIVAAWRRVSDYGLTVWRVYMVVSIVLVVVWTGVSFVRREKATLVAMVTGMVLFGMLGIPKVMTAERISAWYNERYDYKDKKSERVQVEVRRRTYRSEGRKIGVSGYDEVEVVEYTWVDNKAGKVVMRYRDDDVYEIEKDRLAEAIARANGYESIGEMADGLREREEREEKGRKGENGVCSVVEIDERTAVILNWVTIEDRELEDLACRGLLRKK